MIFGICGNTSKLAVRNIVLELIDWLQKRKIEFILETNLYKILETDQVLNHDQLKNLGEKCSIVLSFGGDGTLLATARAIGPFGVPLLGVNLGRLGFLTEVVVDELYDRLEDILTENYNILERMVLQASVAYKSKKQNYFALNDFVIDRGGFSRVIRIEVYIDGEYLNTYLGDGTIIATPTGSTAYSLSAAGPILVPSVECVIINPICPHSLGVRPVVIPDNSIIRLIPYMEGGIVNFSVDGQVNKQYCEGENVEIIIQKAYYKIKWIQHKDRKFYDLLRTKLNWGMDKRM